MKTQKELEEKLEELKISLKILKQKNKNKKSEKLEINFFYRIFFACQTTSFLV